MSKVLHLNPKIKPLTDPEKLRLIEWLENYFREQTNDKSKD